jgi:AsmA-like C-terminal region
VVQFAGAYDDTQPSRPLKGRFTSEKIVFTQVPILTKLLTLASLRGIADTISGKGIAFDTISSDVTYADETFTLRNTKVKGDAMGVLLEGTVAPYGAGKINVKGTLAPSTMINTLPGKVPVIGQLLVGGEDEGVFGAKFAVRGTLEKPDIIVNPLSILTPGFLRNIFDIFPDSDAESKGDTAPVDAKSQPPQSYQR